jgi:hypothetical protein
MMLLNWPKGKHIKELLLLDISHFDLLNNEFFINEMSGLGITLPELDILYSYYIQNLAKIVQMEKFHFSFLTKEEFVLPDYMLKLRFGMGEEFVDTTSILSFGKEVERNGTLWPIITSDHIIVEGVHRAYCLRAIGSDRKWLCWEFPSRVRSENLDTKLDFYLPFPSKHARCCPFIEEVDSNMFLIKLTTYEGLIRFNVLFSKYFSKVLLQYRDVFQVSSIINSEESFNEWRSSLQ